MNKRHKLNLIKTALYILKDNTMEFWMRDYATNAKREPIGPDLVLNCGTSCCFVGYGPVAGVRVRMQKFRPPPGKPNKPKENWDTYMYRVFGVTYWDQDYHVTDSYRFLFYNEWPSDRLFAAKRALMYLEKDLSDGNFGGIKLNPAEGSIKGGGWKEYRALSQRQVMYRLNKLRKQLECQK